MRAHRCGAAAVALVAVGLAGTAAAASAAADPVQYQYHLSEMHLFIGAAEPEADGESAMSWLRYVSLDCRPEGGSHPDPEHACAVLEEAGGDFAAIAPGSGMCTLEYAPVRIAAHGHWNGGSVEYAETHPNMCHAIRATQDVFDF